MGTMHTLSLLSSHSSMSRAMSTSSGDHGFIDKAMSESKHAPIFGILVHEPPLRSVPAKVSDLPANTPRLSAGSSPAPQGPRTGASAAPLQPPPGPPPGPSGAGVVNPARTAAGRAVFGTSARPAGAPQVSISCFGFLTSLHDQGSTTQKLDGGLCF